MSVTGYDTFVFEARNLGRVIDHSTVRVMLMNPTVRAPCGACSHSATAPLSKLRQETAATGDRLASHGRRGKEVMALRQPALLNLISPIVGQYATPTRMKPAGIRFA
jgi:hypothetical protein